MPYNGYRRAVALLACLAAPIAGAAESAGDIVVEIGGYDGGAVHAALHTATDTAWEAPVLQQTGTTDAIRFTDVPAGHYAIRLFVDRNGDGVLQRSRRAIPLEPVGFSTNPSLLKGEPAPAAVAFAHDGSATRLMIRLQRSH